MNTRLINAMVVGAALVSLPAIGSAAVPTPMQGCVRAFMQELTAGATKPMKVIEGGEVDSSSPYLGSVPEYVLTARDAQSHRTIASVVCTTDNHGKVLLVDDPLN